MCISKGIIEELGGSISFETEVGAGTTFFVDIPEIR
jgi:signal transduction histidine kinase